MRCSIPIGKRGPVKQYPPSSLNSSSERRDRSCTRFLSITFAKPIGSRPDVTITLSRCHPPTYCDSREELVVDDGIKTLDLHLCVTCRELSAANFDSIYLGASYYYVYRQSNLYKIMY